MSDFELVLMCLIIPVTYVFVYIAGKYDLLILIGKNIARKARRNE